MQLLLREADIFRQSLLGDKRFQVLSRGAQRMDGLRRTAVCVLSLAAILVSACATSAKKVSEELRNEGFSICIYNAGGTAAGPTVDIIDAESTEKLSQWFRHCPHASGNRESKVVQQAVAHSPERLSHTLRIETTCLRVEMPIFVKILVVMETRATPDDEWKKTSWKMRKEDDELQRWAISRISKEYKQLMEQGQLTIHGPETDAVSPRENNSLDRDETSTTEALPVKLGPSPSLDRERLPGPVGE